MVEDEVLGNEPRTFALSYSPRIFYFLFGDIVLWYYIPTAPVFWEAEAGELQI